MVLESIATTQQLTRIERPDKSTFNLAVLGIRNTFKPQPWRTTGQPTKPITQSIVLQMRLDSTAQSSTTLWLSAKPVLEPMLLEMRILDPQPSTLVIEQDFVPWARIWRRIFEPAIFEIPTDDLFSDWRMAIEVQPSRVLDMKLTDYVSRSRSLNFECRAPFPRPHTTTIAFLGTPSTRLHLVSKCPSPTKKNAKLQVVQAKIVEQVKQQREAMSRASKSARVLRDTWRHDKNYRHRQKVKKQAEKLVRSSSYKLHAIRMEEMDLLAKLEKKRRRNCEEWGYVDDQSHGMD